MTLINRGDLIKHHVVYGYDVGKLMFVAAATSKAIYTSRVVGVVTDPIYAALHDELLMIGAPECEVIAKALEINKATIWTDKNMVVMRCVKEQTGIVFFSHNLESQMQRDYL